LINAPFSAKKLRRRIKPVDLWLGEGLVYALASGKMAAESILVHMWGHIRDLGKSTQQVNERLTAQRVYARRLTLLVPAFLYLSLQAISASERLQVFL